MTTHFRSARLLLVLPLLLLLHGPAPAQEDSGIRVTVSEEIVSGHATYHYTITNSGDRAISALFLGFDKATGDFELAAAPLGWEIDTGIVAGTIASPAGWEPDVLAVEGSNAVRVEWGTGVAGGAYTLAPGQTLTGFSVLAEGIEPSYLSSHWTAILDNGGARTGQLERAPAPPSANDITGVVVPGQPVSLTFDAPGQNARLTFEAAAGERYSLLVSATSLPGASVFIAGLDGTPLGGALRAAAGGTAFMEPVTVSAGMHTVIVDPDGLGVGNLTFTLFMVPPDIVQPLVIGDPLTIALNTPAQNARLPINGTAGQRVSVTLANVTIPAAVVSLIAPDGSVVQTLELDTSGGVIDEVELPATGTSLLIDPLGPNTGGVTVTLHDSTDLTLTITPGGPPVTVQIQNVGQNARLTFTGMAGQRVSLLISSYTLSIFTQVSIVAPDGAVLNSGQLHSGGEFRDAMTLPSSGTYTIAVDPPADSVGVATLTLYDIPADVTATIVSGGPSVTVAPSVPGQNARITFSGTAGQRITVQMTGVTIARAQVTILNPDASALATMTVQTATAALEDRQLPATGTYTIVVDPFRENTGSMTLALLDATDVLATITPAGPAVRVTTTIPGQNARVTFPGAAGQRISLVLSSVTIGSSTCCSARVSMTAPDGAVLVAPRYFGTSGTFVDVVALPAAGTYTILIDPDSTATGGVTLTLHDVPPDPSMPIVPGGSSVTVTLGTPGQNGRLTFTGTPGQRVSLELTGVTIIYAQVTILNPDGTSLASRAVFSANAFIDSVALLVAGTYTILVDPTGANTGSATLRLHSVTDVTGTIVPGGSPVDVTIGTPGQNARYTFDGTSGQRISLQVTGASLPGNVAILNPNGTTLANAAVTGTSAFIDMRTLGSTGIYTVLVDPSSTNTGVLRLTLHDVPPDVTGTLEIAGAPVPLTILTPGQNAAYTFAGTAGQQVMLQASAVTIASSTVNILRPDGTVLATRAVGTSGGNIDGVMLPVTGTYTVTVNPSGANTGNMTLRLFDASDVTATIVVGGPAVTINIPTAGRNARVTFDASAGTRVSLRLTGVTIGTSACCSARLSMLRPDGTAFVSPTFFGTNGAFVDVQTLTASGTHTIFVDPDGTATGDVTLTLYDVPADFSAPIVPGGDALTATVTIPGQNALLTFTGAAGQRVSIRISPVTIASSTVTLLGPGGASIASTSITTSGGFIDVRTLAAAGTHTVRVDPSSANTGSATVTVYDVPADVATPIVPGGDPVPVALLTPGQNAQLPFEGTAGQRVSLRTTSSTIGSATVALVNPDGSTLGSMIVGTSGGFLDVRTLPVTGSYLVRVDPSGTSTGNATVSLYDVPPDPVHTVTIGGPAAAVATSAPGQNATVTFEGTAGQQVTVRLADNTMGLVTIKLLRPDGTTQTTRTSSAAIFATSTVTLAVSGTYTISVDPSGANVGIINVRVTNP
jgi:hypothetical protein